MFYPSGSIHILPMHGHFMIKIPAGEKGYYRKGEMHDLILYLM